MRTLESKKAPDSVECICGYNRTVFIHQCNASFTEVNSLTTFTEGYEETEALQPIADLDFHKLLEPFDKNDYAGKIIRAIFDLDMEAPTRVHQKNIKSIFKLE